MISCPKCSSIEVKKSGMIPTTIMSKSGKRTRKIQAYRCNNNHFFKTGSASLFADSFKEIVVFIYLRCLSLNTTVDIVRAFYEDVILTKAGVLDFVEQVADALPELDDIDRLFSPVRSGYLALDGVWFDFKDKQIVLLVCFDPVSFDVVSVQWSFDENTESYTQLLKSVISSIGANNIKGIYGDGDPGLLKSLKVLLPNTPFQICVVHKEMRMGQLVPVKIVGRSRKMSSKSKREIIEFQELFRAVIYADDKESSLKAMKRLKKYVDKGYQTRFAKAYRSLKRNFTLTLTHFDHPEMMRDNNLIECFNGIIKTRLKLMKGFKKEENIPRYLKIFFLDYRFRPLKESRFKDRRNLSPLQLSQVSVPDNFNFLTFLRTTLKLKY